MWRFSVRAYLTEFLLLGSAILPWLSVAIFPASHGIKYVDCMQNMKTRLKVFMTADMEQVGLIVCIWLQVLQYFDEMHVVA